MHPGSPKGRRMQGDGAVAGPPVSAVLRAVLFAVVALTPSVSAAAQDIAPIPRLAYPDRAELLLLAPTSGGTEFTPSGRLSYQHRLTLRLSATASTVLLTDPLSHTVGVLAGGSVALPVGPLLVEPFAEAGLAWADARIFDGSYRIQRDGQVETVERYLAASGTGPLVGAGIALEAGLTRHLTGRLTVGWWRATVDAARLGGLHVGVGIGLGRPDRRWYQHRVDETPPVLVAPVTPAGEIPVAEADVAGRIEIAAADASGIAGVFVDGEPVDYGPVASGTGDPVLPTVHARPRVRVGPGGRVVPVTVVDSGGVSTSRAVYVLGPPDRTGPTLAVAPPTDGPWPEVRVEATDPSGVVDARVGVCPVEPIPAGPWVDGSPSRWLIWAPVVDGGRVRVEARDQAGNESEIDVPVPGEVPQAEGPAPALVDGAAEVASRAGPHQTVRVHGRIRPPEGVPVLRVRVNDRPAALKDDGRHVTFDGWLITDEPDTVVAVQVILADGRASTHRLPITEQADASPAGRLHVLTVAGRTTAAVDPIPTRAARGGMEDTHVVETVRQVQNALQGTADAVAPTDAVLVHVSGTLLPPQLRPALDAPRLIDLPAPPSDPLLAFADGTLTLTELGELISAIPAHVVLVSTEFRTSRGWGALPRLAPGALPPAGCSTSELERRAGIVDLRGAALPRIQQAIDGVAELDGDGRVRAGEILEFLDVPTGDGLLSFDPLAEISPGGVR